MEEKLASYEKVGPLGSVHYKDFLDLDVTPCNPQDCMYETIFFLDWPSSGHHGSDVNELYDTLNGIFVW